MHARHFLSAGLMAAISIQVPAMAETASAPVAAAENGWVSEAPPGTKVMGGFLTVINRTQRAISLQKVDSPLFSAVHMHAVRKQDGQEVMEMMTELVIPPGASFQFVPGGTHLMLMNPQRTLKTGDHVPLTLDFGKDGRLALSLPVKRPGATLAQAHHHGAHDAKPHVPLPAPPPWSAAGALQERLVSAGLTSLRGNERLSVNFVVKLDVFYEGKPVVVPADLGIDRANRLVSPLHTHQADGQVSVESPERKDFTLRQFFTVWGVPLEGATVYVNGVATTDPASVVLAEGQHIAVVYGAPPASIPGTPANR